jgi:hypothetical protein
MSKALLYRSKSASTICICRNPSVCPRDEYELCLHREPHYYMGSCATRCQYLHGECVEVDIPVLDFSLGLTDNYIEGLSCERKSRKVR